jgi:hypothetical protein
VIDMSWSSATARRGCKRPAATKCERRATLDLSVNALEPRPPFIRRLTAAPADAGAVRLGLLRPGDRSTAGPSALLAWRGPAGALRRGSAGPSARRAGGREAHGRATRHGHEV